jgi:hypothetical protein
LKPGGHGLSEKSDKPFVLAISPQLRQLLLQAAI